MSPIRNHSTSSTTVIGLHYSACARLASEFRQIALERYSYAAVHQVRENYNSINIGGFGGLLMYIAVVQKQKLKQQTIIVKQCINFPRGKRSRL